MQLLAVSLLIAVGGITLLQDRLLYFPERVPLADLLAMTRADRLQAWPGEGDFRGLVREPDGPARATLVLFHGNAGHAGHRAAYAPLAALGVRVILAEYPGYGPRGGGISEAALVADAADTLRQVRQQFGGPLLVAGESLGAGVVAAAAGQPGTPADGMLLLTPWDNLAAVAGHHYPWLPVRLLLRDRYDSAGHLAQATVPVGIVVAGRDDIVPAQFGVRLHDGLATPKRLWRLDGAGHNDWLDRVDAAWWREVLGFFVPAIR